MRPERTRVLRRERRRAWRQLPGPGRRHTHQVTAVYGRGQAERDRLAAWAAARQAETP